MPSRQPAATVAFRPGRTAPAPEALHFRRIDSEGFDAALVAEVDSLLASKHFGERWGRHWLDVARFGESSGKEANLPFPMLSATVTM